MIGRLIAELAFMSLAFARARNERRAGGISEQNRACPQSQDGQITRPSLAQGLVNAANKVIE
jgi:hypothetical protein